jgi:hypothetical protein
MKRIALVSDARFPDVAELPLYERDPAETCATCSHLVRLKQHELDIEGRLFCKEGPPAITTLPAGNMGETAQLAAAFSPAHPHQWCFRWQARAAAAKKSVLQG